ncbi:glycosyltransferase [uncultured Maribacter sp.]|uniref:glycosyltransferase n=1 Tax=uncultured Maribacter sp. TaxID=431308 RepID=UPI00262FCE9E|nr:glycosyltransferase [uncultured Maribacter sp.]
MKKVLLSAYACSPFRGSEWNVGWSWATGLAQKGYKVFCVINVEDQEDCEKEKKRLQLHNLTFVPIGLSYNLDKYLLNNSSKTIYLHYYLWKKKAANSIQKLHKKECFAIAHHVSYGSFQQGSPLYKLENCKIIFGPVGGGQMALPIFKPYFGTSWRIEIIRKYVSKFHMRYNHSLKATLKKATIILTANQETTALLKTSKFYKEGSDFYVSDSALPVRFEKNTFTPKLAKKEFRILWVGRLLARRGLELSLKSLSYLPDSIPYRLIIVGDGEQANKIDCWITKYQLDKTKIEHLGWVAYDQMHQEYKNADILLFCPLRDTAGLQATEAMGFGLPVITLNISGMRTIVPSNCGIKIDPTTTNGTAKDIALAIEQMYKDEDFRKKASENAFNEAIQNTWKRKIDRITRKFYETKDK